MLKDEENANNKTDMEGKVEIEERSVRIHGF